MSSPAMADKPRRRRATPSRTLDEVFAALAHSARRQVLVTLHARGGVMTAGEIADRFRDIVVRADVGPVFSGMFEGSDSLETGLWVVRYGVRIFGDGWYGDIGFILPAHDAYFESVGFLTSHCSWSM